MVLVFRMYGRFHWPPLPEPPDGEPTLQDGIVEVRCESREARQHAFLRFVQGPRSGPLPDGPAPVRNLFEFDDPITAAGALLDGEALWLVPPKHAPDPIQWLTFRGAFLFEQFGEGDDAPLEVQWPLGNYPRV